MSKQTKFKRVFLFQRFFNVAFASNLDKIEFIIIENNVNINVQAKFFDYIAFINVISNDHYLVIKKLLKCFDIDVNAIYSNDD